MIKRWGSLLFFLVLALVLARVSIAHAENYQSVIDRWTQERSYKDSKYGGELKVRATFYSGDVIEAIVQKEAEQNLWTAEEMENFKYQFLKGLRLDDYLTVRLDFDNNGPAMHMSPFGSQVALWVGGKKYLPAEYDTRFNIKLLGQREGLVHFPKYDEKTGKALISKDMTVKLTINGGISALTMGKSIDFLWDIRQKDQTPVFEGKAGAKLEMDRLIRRLEKLNGEKKDLEEKLEQLKLEIEKIQARMNELQKQ